jgi:hypothetical protein
MPTTSLVYKEVIKMKKLIILLPVLLFALVIGGCSNLDKLPIEEDNPQASSSNIAVIHWDGITYEYVPQTLLDEDQIGEKLGEIIFKLEGSEEGYSRTLQNGDATFLNVGTEVFKVKGQDALAVKGDQGWTLYQEINIEN